MPSYKIVMKNSDGTKDEIDDIFNSEEDAEEHALYLVSCDGVGNEILNLSNPGDNPLEDYEEPDFEIIEIDN